FCCLAALFRLIISRWLHRSGCALYNCPMKNRLLALAGCILWLEIDLQFTNHGIWQASILLMIVHGVPYGISVGAVCFAPLVALDRRLNRPRAMRQVAGNGIDKYTPTPDSA